MDRIEMYIYFMIALQQQEKKQDVQTAPTTKRKKQQQVKLQNFTKKWYSKNFDKIKEICGIESKIAHGDFYNLYLRSFSPHFDIKLYDKINELFLEEYRPKKFVIPNFDDN